MRIVNDGNVFPFRQGTEEESAHVDLSATNGGM
jgi:hypothetical protein